MCIRDRAYSTPSEMQYRCKDLAERAIGYGIPGVIVDGTDACQVYDAARDAVERSHRGEGPTPVSYTHLDVYKRQGRSHAGRGEQRVWNCDKCLTHHGGTEPRRKSRNETGFLSASVSPW